MFFELSCTLTELQYFSQAENSTSTSYKDSKVLNTILKHSYLQKIFDSSSF